MLKRLFEYYKRLFWSLEKQARQAGVSLGKNNDVFSHFWDTEPYLITVGNYCQITGGGKILYTRWCWSCKENLSQI